MTTTISEGEELLKAEIDQIQSQFYRRHHRHHNMHLLTLIVGTLLLPNACSLKCYECTGTDSCTSTEKTCPANNQCGALRIFSYAGGSTVSETHIKSCVLDNQCIGGSLNFGISRTVMASKCCTSDLCNAQAPPEPGRTKPNGKKCFQCDSQACKGTLNCEGDEDRCISATVPVEGKDVTVKGCVSKALCTNSGIPGFGGEIRCCQGDYCNSSSNLVPAGLLAMMMMAMMPHLISLLMLS